MSADPKNPKVGDEFVTQYGRTLTVTAVGESRLLYRSDDCEGEFVRHLADVAEYWKPAPARPTVAEQWALLDDGGRLDVYQTEEDAKAYECPDYTLARICHHPVWWDPAERSVTVAVVCDGDGRPIEVAE